jgi:tRNA threonylcarbamoyladenosine biosynthesis protein TsaB
MKVLVIDTCGAEGSVALGDGGMVVAQETMAARGASAELVMVMARLMEEQGWTVGELDGVGVVSGPGSFTGVRVGLSAAKGLCEAAGLRLAAVSRLAVLAEVGGLTDGFAVLDAGRGEFCVGVVEAGAMVREVLWGMEELRERTIGGRVVIAEERLVEKIGEAEVVAVFAGDALGLVERRLEGGGDDVGLVDANYGRGELEIYGKPVGGVGGAA